MDGACDHGGVNRPIGYWVKRLDAALERLLDSSLSRLGLSIRQWRVLNVLRSGPASPAEIEDTLRSSAKRGAAQQHDMAALVRNNLVFLLDGRLALTDAGLALHAEVSGLFEDTAHELTAGIGTDEYATAVSVMERMSNNADRLGPG